ncbi:HAD-IA family hydrolase [Tessaracoccus sp. MC1865]|uniref:HAD family hydrolase n=1 Tax=Tessaracoccus sp. MC1865 TaxID=2760310 RepID=UPI001602BDFF|nr:HAD-IA family hydrolase [Tessaracoccus sp. MC1865]MBB1484398.1 HAD-IA family hydrolase [Tessaracoccus sp. MC1865]QTO38495.1 HAD-IA family hydrolase [Tessaracoccus sp. MC1865]
MEWSDYQAVLFDLDGVITPTAEVHMHAWADMFNGFLSTRSGQLPYTDDDYFAFVDGKPRYDGVRDFLLSRGIVLPEGRPTDDPSQLTVCGLGNRKNEAFNTIIERDGVAPYPGSKLLVEQLAAGGFKLAVVSSSKNAPAILRAAGLAPYFPVVMDGNVAARAHIAGKPAPDTFIHAAQMLDVPTRSAVVVEDAISGVAAGAAGDFGLVIGVDRGVGHEALLVAGADVVVDDLRELTA